MQVWQLQEPFCSLRSPVTSLPKLYFILSAQTKNVISMSYRRSSTSGWKSSRWVRLHLKFTRDIHINSNLDPLTKFTSSSRSTKLKDILPWNISQMSMKTTPISTRIVESYAIKWDISLWRKAIVEQILASRKKSKRAGLWESQSEIRVGKLTIW